MTPKFLANRKNRFWLSVMIIIVGIVAAIYYATIPAGNTVGLFGYSFSAEDSRLFLIAIPIILTIILSGIVNILFADAHEAMKEPTPFVGSPVQPIVNVNIDRNALLQPDLVPAPPQTISAAASDLKFYPGDFLPDFKYFVGRKELLKKLDAALKKHHRASIHDISGLGKTFASLKFASDHQAEYQKIFFINAAKESYLESMAELAVMLMPELAQNDNQQERALGFKAWLEKNVGWLAIYDNVDEPAVLKTFIPNNLKGDCVFTSNFRAVENIAPHRIGIDELEPEFARILLYSRARNKPESEPEFPGDAERQAFENLIIGIDGLPIALLTTGAIINRDQLEFAEFWEMFQKADEVVLEAEDEFGDYKKRSALRAFSIALDDISKDSKSDIKAIKAEKAAVREMLNAACLLFPDDIPEEFLQGFLEKNLTGFDISDKKQWIALRNRFSNFDLFKFGSTAKSFSTHRLIQKCIFSRLSVADKKVYAEKVLHLLLDFFPIYDYTNKAQCERYYQHALAALENADRTGFEAGLSVTLYYKVARYQELLGSYAQAEKFYARNLEIARKVYGEEAAETAISFNNLAEVYRAQGRYDEANGLFQQAIEIIRKALGKEHPNYATSLNNLADTYRAQGKYDEAIELYKPAMEIDEKTIGKEHPDYAIGLKNLAMVYQDKGELDEARKLYSQASEIQKKVLGENHPDYAKSLSGLGIINYLQGDLDEAIRLHKQSLEIGGKTIGKEHPDYATRLNSLAAVYLNQEKYSEALPHFEEALRIWEAKLPPEHPHIANVKVSIAFCKSKIGNG